MIDWVYWNSKIKQMNIDRQRMHQIQVLNWVRNLATLVLSAADQFHKAECGK